MPKCKIQEHDIQCNWKKNNIKDFFLRKELRKQIQRKTKMVKGNQQRNTESIYRYMNTAVGIYQ